MILSIFFLVITLTVIIIERKFRFGRCKLEQRKHKKMEQQDSTNSPYLNGYSSCENSPYVNSYSYQNNNKNLEYSKSHTIKILMIVTMYVYI